MHSMTEQNMKNAFAGESQAHMKYLAFADAAEREGKPNIARMFRAISYAEQVHAVNHLKVLGGLKKTKDNLETALAGETFEIDEMYPVYLNDAKMQHEKEAEKSSHYALEAEKVHAVMYKNAIQAVSAGKDVEAKEFSICPICGYTTDEEIPDYCPVCGAKGSTFKTF